MSDIGIFIPARLKSTRLKEKMLIDVSGKPLIRAVYDRVKEFGFNTYVLTDSKKIASVIPENCIITPEYNNGTERIASVLDRFDFSYFINVQGDLLDVSKDLIDTVVNNIVGNDVVTVYSSYDSSVKVVHSNSYAHWFTRSNLGYGDNHVGIYGYSRKALEWYLSEKRTEPEIKEDLEQLRFFNKYKIKIVNFDYKGREVNTKEDL